MSKCSTAKVTVASFFTAIVLVYISKSHYQGLQAGSTPFVCLVCTQQFHKAELSNLHSVIDALKLELCEIRKSIQEAGASNRDTVQELKIQVDELRSTVTTKSETAKNAKKKSYADSVRKNAKNHSSTSSTRNCVAVKVQNGTASHIRGEPSIQRELVGGARRVWGTLRSATQSSVKNTILHLEDTSSIQVYKTKV